MASSRGFLNIQSLNELFRPKTNYPSLTPISQQTCLLAHPKDAVVSAACLEEHHHI